MCGALLKEFVMLASLNEFYIWAKDPEEGRGKGPAKNIGAFLKGFVMLVSTLGALQDI